MKEPTEDTKRALAVIKPLADQIGISVSADDWLLYCNGQAIGIDCNSTYATIKEFIGYAVWFLDKTDTTYRLNIPSAVKKRIQRYWLSPEVISYIRMKSEPAICPDCGKPFMRESYRNKYCDECSTAAARQRRSRSIRRSGNG